MSLFDDLPEPESATESLKNIEVPAEKNDKVSLVFHDNGLSDSSSKRKSIDSYVSESESETKRLKHSGILTLQAYVAERRGEREDMQDAHTICDKFHEQTPNIHPSVERLAFYAVFDGHGGCKASHYCAENFSNYLLQRFPEGDVAKVEADIKKCFIESFKKCDEEFLKFGAKQKPSWKDGTTAAAVLAINNTLYIANLGDSKAILCRTQSNGKLTAIPLTKDHSPSDYEERQRIQKAGGYVKDGRVMGILEVSRSIGDGQFKKHGVICFPDIKKCQLTPDDRFLIIACDGLWKAFDNQSAIEFANKIITDTGKDANGEPRTVVGQCELACNELANEGVRRLSADNVTVILVHISSSS